MLETLTLFLVVLNAVGAGIGLGIVFSKRKLDLDIKDKLKNYDDIAEAASNSSQSIARKVADLNDKVTAMAMKLQK